MLLLVTARRPPRGLGLSVAARSAWLRLRAWAAGWVERNLIAEVPPWLDLD